MVGSAPAGLPLGRSVCNGTHDVLGHFGRANRLGGFLRGCMQDNIHQSAWTRSFSGSYFGRNGLAKGGKGRSGAPRVGLWSRGDLFVWVCAGVLWKVGFLWVLASVWGAAGPDLQPPSHIEEEEEGYGVWEYFDNLLDLKVIILKSEYKFGGSGLDDRRWGCFFGVWCGNSNKGPRDCGPKRLSGKAVRKSEV